MGTVLVDRYRVFCSCGFDKEFKVGAGMGDLHAAKRGEEIHATEAPPGCDGVFVRVEVIQRA